MIRCCLCREPEHRAHDSVRARWTLEPTTLPGGYRCTDHIACRERVRGIVAAHMGLGEVCDG